MKHYTIVWNDGIISEETSNLSLYEITLNYKNAFGNQVLSVYESR